jgi:hypothetical protein
MLKDIAAKILAGRAIAFDTANLRPVYISKSRMKSGVRAIVNEAVLDWELENLGIAVAHPERLSFAEQIAFWSAKRKFIAFSSSSLHMTAFAGNQSVAVIHYDGHANSNQMLLDVAAANNALYIHPVSGMEKVDGNSEFGALHQLGDPRKMAKDIATVLEAFEGGATKSVSTIQSKDHTLSPLVNVNDPLGFNIGATGVASQSSLYRHDEGCNRTPEGALSGRLTGRYQCHTDVEAAPWWQVELPALCAIYEVRVYNRCDNPEAKARLDRVVTLLSDDGELWQKMSERNEGRHAGGIDGYPYRLFLPPGTVARFVRLQTFNNNFLHFDQVEVFGEPAEGIWFKRRRG